MKLLIVKLHALGDLVIATPAIRRLSEGLENVKIDLLTTSYSAPAVKGNPYVDNCIVIRDELFFKPGLKTLLPTLRLILRLRKTRYDAAVIFHQHSMIRLFIRFMGISKRFSFDIDNTDDSVFLDDNRHSVLTALELADLAISRLGGSIKPLPLLNDLKYEWYVQPEENQQTEEILQRRFANETKQSSIPLNFAVILPGGGVNPKAQDKVKRWPIENFIGLIEQITNNLKFKIVLLGGKSDREVAEIIVNKTNTQIINLCGETDLRLSAAIMKNSRVVICNDSGPLHIAAAVGAPVVGIFGPTGVRHKLPPGKSSLAACLWLPCSPCYFSVFKGCIFDKIRCLEDLSVDDVMKVVYQVIH
ncbi:MAG: glycosyltransferase family 9 protein [Candidatus Hatepunaea meridiana]|nr:glycosyltransferase family 9 protein [Candidatus Hatepunaea meridiana]